MMQIIQGPLGILIGILFGIIWGYVCHFVPHQKDKQAVLLRVLMMIGGGLMAIVGSGIIGYQGAGPLGCIVAAFTASLGWKMEGQTEENVSSVLVNKILSYRPLLIYFRFIFCSREV